MRETGGLKLASTITLVLQANRLTNCASQNNVNLKKPYKNHSSVPPSATMRNSYYIPTSKSRNPHPISLTSRSRKC